MPEVSYFCLSSSYSTFLNSSLFNLIWISMYLIAFDNHISTY